MSSATPRDVRAIMNKYGLRPQKKWGQNFLIDKNILNKIIDAAELKPDEYVVEIGPGLGGLTRQLAGKCRGVLAIEVDRHMQKPLEELLGDVPGVHLLFEDVLEVDLEKEIKHSFGLLSLTEFSVCANIPYNITSPILFKLLEECPAMRSATLMMQKEVAGRILASPGGKDYGILTLTAGYHAQAEFVMDVSRNCFYPKPDVDSRVVKIRPYKIKPLQIVKEKEFKDFIRAAFQKRRKTMLNICADFFKVDKKHCEELFVERNIHPEVRPEKLELEQFALLFEGFSR